MKTLNYFLDESNPEKIAADCIMLLEDEPPPPETVEIHNDILKSYNKHDGYGIVLDNQSAYKLKIDAVIDDCLKRYLQDTPSFIEKSVQFILHWNKSNKVIHSLILAKKERIALNKQYGLTESTVQLKLMSPETLPDYKPLSPIHSTIRTDNIFKVGGIVEGESLIGYKEKYQSLRKKILDEQKSILFIGLPKTGKTSLIKKLHQEAKSNKKIIDIFISNLQDFASKENPFATFLFDIAEKLKNELFKRDNLNTRIADEFHAGFDELQKYYTAHNYEKFFQDTFKKLFQKIKNFGMHVLLSVDEFDSAEKIFKNTADYTIFDDLTNPKYAISTVLISSRQETKSNENVIVLSGLSVPCEFLKLISEKHNVRMRPETIYLEGFSDGDKGSDIELIFSILRREYGIHLSAVQIKQIRYYAGRSPYIYSAFCYHIVEEKLQSGKNSFDIEKIYKDNVEQIIADYTKVLYTLLENDGQLDKINNRKSAKIQTANLSTLLKIAVDQYAMSGNFIKISMYDDRLEIENLNKIPNIVNLENIKETRYYRNPRISRVLTEFGWVNMTLIAPIRLFK